jgi:hypothetical protein
MSWAGKRRLLVSLIVGSVLGAFFIVFGIATFYDTPTCSDGKQNQGENGPDCGGPCAYLCTTGVTPPTVLFTKALTNSAGRTDIAALVENKNYAAAAKDVPYKIALYGKDQVLLQELNGKLDLPPGTSVAVFIPSVVSGKQPIANAFLTIDSAAPNWFTVERDMRIVPVVSGTRETGSVGAPRIESVLANPSTVELKNVQTVVFVRDARGEIIAASRTIVPSIPPQSSATATFTWNVPFPKLPAAIEVLPIIPLPR